MKFRDYVKDRIANDIGMPYTDLADQIGTKGQREAAIKVFNELIGPALVEMEKAAPEVYARLPKGEWLVTENKKVDLGYQVPKMVNLVSEHEGSYGDSGDNGRFPVVISNVLVSNAMTGEAKELALKSIELRQKATTVVRGVKEFLKAFEDPAQVMFSFPQLRGFIESEYGRKIQPQKRPKIYAVPSDELKNLVTQSLILKDAKGRR